MRIEGYGLPLPGTTSSGMRPTAPAAPQKREADFTTEAAELSPQEKFRQLLEQKKTVMDGSLGLSPEAELGKHIDLRV